jgi:hypothetical protein
MKNSKKITQCSTTTCSKLNGDSFTVTEAAKKYGIQNRTCCPMVKKIGNFDWENKNTIYMSKSPEQKIMELEAKVKLRETEVMERQAFCCR